MRILAAIAVLVLALLGIYSARSEPAVAWGERGAHPGGLVRPRAAAIIGERLYLVDFTARIQSYEFDGTHTGLTFTTPDYRNGRPSGLGVDRQGRLIVCDSHYNCVRIYDDAAREVQRLTGDFGYVSDCVQDAAGNYYVSEFGQHDRITKLDAAGNVLARWGRSGSGPGEFLRVRALAIGPDGRIFAVDSCNHRIQAFLPDGTLSAIIGGPGNEQGRFHLPFDIAFGPGGEFYVVERGNCRVQKFDRSGRAMGAWGANGRGPGQLADPWALAVDDRGRVFVVDTENHRVHRVKF